MGKHQLIKNIIDTEIWLGKLKLEYPSLVNYAKKLYSSAIKDLEGIYRSVIRWKFEREKLVDKAIYEGTGREIPKWLVQSNSYGDDKMEQKMDLKLYQTKEIETADVLEQEQKQPESVIIWKTTVEERFIPSKEFHPDSFRMAPPGKEADIRIWLGCLKKHHWDPETLTCEEGQTVHKIIMPKTPKYLEKGLSWKDRGVPIIYREDEVGIEPRPLVLTNVKLYSQGDK